MLLPAPDEPTGRAATEAALVASARRVLTRTGYDGAGVREIAAGAGVDAALVNRYFGSKQGLLRAALGGAFRVGDLLVGERATLGVRLARWLVRRPAPSDGVDPGLLLVRSAGSAEAQAELRAAFEAQVVGALAAWLGPPDATARARAVASVLFGAVLVRDVLSVPTARTGAVLPDDEAFAEAIGAAIQRVIDGEARG